MLIYIGSSERLMPGAKYQCLSCLFVYLFVCVYICECVCTYVHMYVHAHMCGSRKTA